eukprot:SAG11_NODE_11076_length_785_cov_1.141399_2_plen_95_part_00
MRNFLQRQAKLAGWLNFWLAAGWYPGPESVWVHCVQNWTLGKPAFPHELGQLSMALETPWLLYVPFFCGRDLGGNVYEDESVAGGAGSGYKFVQ